jgi:hypothetical protein
MTGEYLQHTSNEARENLDKYLSELKPMPGARVNVKWANHRSSYIERFGQNAVGALIPEEINVTSALITNTINHLCRYGVNNIHDLANTDLDKLRQNRGFGPEVLEFSGLLKAAASEKIKNMRSGYLPE